MRSYVYYCRSCRLEKDYGTPPSDPRCTKCGKSMELRFTRDRG